MTDAFPVLVLMWFGMMGAMMLPVSLPWLRALASLAAPAPGPELNRWATGRSMFPFMTGYLGVWLAFSIVAAGVQLGLAAAGILGAGGPLEVRIGGAFLIGAGVYQATPLKTACLRHCRNPLTYFLTAWRDGPVGSLRMGFGHGLFCLGCCWALMALALVLGVMSLVWMALLTATVVIENVAPRGPAIGRVVGAGLVLWGVVVLLAG